MQIVRTLLAATALSLPLANTSCNKTEEKPQAVKLNEGKPEIKLADIKPLNIKSKEVLDKERQTLETKERELAKELGGLASSSLPNILIGLYMVSDSKNDILKARDIAVKIVKRSDDFIELTGNNYSIKKPNEEQLEAFTRLLDMAQKGSPFTWAYSTMEPKEIAEKIEGYLKKNKSELKGEKLKQEVEHELEFFTVYQEDLRNVRKLRNDLFLSMKAFNKDAEKTIEPPYSPVWGISLKKLEDFTIFVHSDKK